MCIRTVPDIAVVKDSFLNKKKYFLISEERNKYIKLNSTQYDFFNEVLPYLKEEHTEEEIDSLISTISNGEFEGDYLHKILKNHNLLNIDHAPERKANIEIELSSNKVKEINLSQAQVKYSRLFDVLFYLMWLMGITCLIGSVFLLVKNFNMLGIIYNETRVFSWGSISILDLILILLGNYICLVIHEIGHLLTAHKMKVRWKSLTISLKWGVSLIVYVRYGNIYSTSSSKRLFILFAGMINNLFLIAFFSIMLITQKDWRYGVLLIINIGFIVNCIMPLSSNDGYHIFSTIYGAEGLRWKMLRIISLIIKKEESPSYLLKNRENIVLSLYFFISYFFGILGCYSVFKTLIEYLNIFNLDSMIINSLLFIVIFLIVGSLLIKFIKNLKEF